jgi:alpha-amylase
LPGKGKPRDENLRKDYQKLIAIRHSHLALSRGSHNSISSEGDVLVFSRTYTQTGDIVIVALNRGTSPAKVTIPAPAEWTGQNVKDVWNDQATSLTGSNIETDLAPRSARIFVRFPLNSATIWQRREQIGSSIPHHSDEHDQEQPLQ